MHILLLCIAALLSIAVLLIAIRFEFAGLAAASKIFASATFLLIAATGFSPADVYGRWMMAALVLCALGDVLLLIPRHFEIGLLTFLAGHLAFAIAFAHIEPIRDWHPLILVPLTAASLAVINWLWPHLGRRKIPVIAYIGAISFMLWGACSVSLANLMPWWTTLGAVLFAISDIMVARNRFVHPSFFNRALGLPVYYSGQILLALSLSITHS